MMAQLKPRLMQLVRVLVSSFALSGFLVAQPSLRITSPANGTVAHPGEQVTVTVDVSPPIGVFQRVDIISTSPIESSKETLKAPPYQFTIQVPIGIRPNRYQVTAIGSTSPGNLVNSNPIILLVERTDLPVRLRVEPATLLDLPTEAKGYLQAFGAFPDGTETNLTQSSLITYTSDTPGVATVGPQGVVAPVAPGSAKIIVAYGKVRAEVPVTVRGH
jgi:hypothetical protein